MKDNLMPSDETTLILPPDEVLRQLGVGDAERGKAVWLARQERHFGKGKVPPVQGDK